MMSTVKTAARTTTEPMPEPQTPSHLLLVATAVLRQAVDLVENVLTSDEQLCVMSKYLPGSTIGKHLRHARDHFSLLIDCISSPPPYILSYDKRVRNTPMETSLAGARQGLLDLIDSLQKVVPGADPNEPLTLNAVTPQIQVFETSFGRELWFAALHAIHHWSMVRVIAGEMNIVLQDDFGFAPSTLLYQGRETPLEKAKI